EGLEGIAASRARSLIGRGLQRATFLAGTDRDVQGVAGRVARAQGLAGVRDGAPSHRAGLEIGPRVFAAPRVVAAPLGGVSLGLLTAQLQKTLLLSRRHAVAGALRGLRVRRAIALTEVVGQAQARR